MPSVYLSPSTQEYNLTINGQTEEYYANLIADAMIPYLEASGINYGRNTPQMTAATSAQQANEGDYGLYLAIHSNAAGENFRGRVRGAEVYYYPGSADGLRAANIFANNYRTIYPLPEFVTIIPSSTLIELNRTRMPSILFETAYHDNPEDFAWLSANIREIGKNFALSVADYFGVQFVEPEAEARGIVSIQSGNLNVRSGPGVSTPIVGSLKNGDIVNVLEGENEWFRIRRGNLSGYVNSRYIRAL